MLGDPRTVRYALTLPSFDKTPLTLPREQKGGQVLENTTTDLVSTKDTLPPRPESQGGGNTAKDNPQSSGEESDKEQTVRTKRSRFRQPADQGLNEPSPRKPPGMFPLPIFPLCRPKSNRFADGDPPGKQFMDTGITTQGPSTKPRSAEEAKEKPEV